MTEPNPVAGAAPQDLPGSEAHGVQPGQLPAAPIRLVRGNASPEELSALITVFAVLASAAANDESDSGSGESERPSWGGGTSSRSRWGSPARLVRRTHPHGPGGWRRSGAPRTDSSTRPAG